MEYCIEDWTIFGREHGRAGFSVISMLVQYVMPISVVAMSYHRICKKLKRRMEEKSQATQIEKTREKAERNFRRTNKLLISISLIFGLSWLPLNLINAFGDLSPTLRDDRKSFLIVFALCHMVGMSSACSNPLLYGWLNESFRKEFKELFSCCRKTSSRQGSPDTVISSQRKRNSCERTETQLIPNNFVSSCGNQDQMPNNNDSDLDTDQVSKRETIVCLT